MSYYTLDVLRIGLGFIGRFPCAGNLQFLLLKTSPKDASEKAQITTIQKTGSLRDRAPHISYLIELEAEVVVDLRFFSLELVPDPLKESDAAAAVDA